MDWQIYANLMGFFPWVFPLIVSSSQIWGNLFHSNFSLQNDKLFSSPGA